MADRTARRTFRDTHRATLSPLDTGLIADFDEHLRRAGKTDGYRDQTRKSLRRLARHLGGRGLLTAQSSDLTAWRSDCLRTASPDTVAKYLGEAVAFYRWAHAKGYVKRNPGAGLLRFGPRPVDDETEQLLADFRAWHRRRNLSRLTVVHRESRVRDLAIWLAPRPVLSATTEDVEAYVDSKDLQPQTAYTYLSLLAAFFAWATRRRLITTNPVDECTRPLYGRCLPRPMDDGDLALALGQADPRMRAWLALAAFAGLRCMEIAGLTVDGLRFNDDPPRILVRGKGNKERAVPMHPEVASALRRYGVPASGFLFTRRDTRQPLNPTTVSRYIGRYLEELGIPGGAHSMRHWFGTRLYTTSLDLRMVQECMGHASPTTTAIYAQVSTVDAARMVGQLGISRSSRTGT
jgi:integrase/recombinase XerC